MMLNRLGKVELFYFIFRILWKMWIDFSHLSWIQNLNILWVSFTICVLWNKLTHSETICFYWVLSEWSNALFCIFHGNQNRENSFVKYLHWLCLLVVNIIGLSEALFTEAKNYLYLCWRLLWMLCSHFKLTKILYCKNCFVGLTQIFNF